MRKYIKESNCKGSETYLTVNKLGSSTGYSSQNKKNDWDNGKETAIIQNNFVDRFIDKRHIVENDRFISEIIEKFNERNIQALLINAPVCKSYSSNLNQIYYDIGNKFCKYFTDYYSNVEHSDFSINRRFSNNDFYDSNHLNEIGAKKVCSYN